MLRFASRTCLALICVVGGFGFGCSKSGTFVVVDFKAGATTPQGIKSIDVGLTLDGKTAMTSYTAPGGGDITLPTSATLEIGSGSGALGVMAKARDKSGAALDTATASGTVTSGSTTHVTVQFGGPAPDGGAGAGGNDGGGTGGTGGEPSDGPPAEGGTDAGPMPPELVTDKAMYDFGTQLTTATGAAVGSTVVTVTNMGGQRSGTIVVGVVDSMTFPTSADTCSGMTLDPGASCTVTVRFMPATAGMKSSKLQITATPGGMAVVMLSGMGVVPGALSLTPDHGTFDPLAMGQTSPEVTFTVKNTGGAATTALTAMLTGTTAGEFKVSTDNCSGKTLAGGEMCTVGVKFAPTAAGTPGAESAVLSVAAMTGGTATANLMGTLLGPAAIAIVPTDQDFQGEVQGMSTPEYLFTVTNKGGVTSGALATGTSPSDEFAITSDTCNGMTLAANGTCKIGVKLTPIGTGMRSASLNVRSTPGGNAVATLRGTGIAPGMIVLSPSAKDFGTVDVGSPSTIPFTVTNTGGAPTTFITLNESGASEFAITADTCTNAVLNPNAMCTFNVVFTPTTYGGRMATIKASAATGGTTMSAIGGVGRDYVTLTVTKTGAGGGTVSASGLMCTNNVCTGAYPRTDPAAFQVVAISETPDSLSTFGTWGGACNGNGACQVTMSANQMVTASFGVKQVVITGTVMSVSGQTGSIVAADGSFTCTTGTCGPTPHNAQATITLTAKVGAASSFIAWSNGPCKGVNPTCVVPLTSDINVTATFGPPNYMFVTSSTVIPGRLGGVAGADAECGARATAAGLPGVYKAWINDNGLNANTRVGPGGWVRTDGRPFTRNLAALMLSNQVVYYPPRVDENGNDLGPKSLPVVTGGNDVGVNFGLQCAGAAMPSWTTTTGGAYIGFAAGGSGHWSFSELDSSGCSTQHHLYCFRTDLAPVGITFPPPPARRIFISDLTVQASAGLGGADAECQADAKAVGYVNWASFVALMATSVNPAIKRVNVAGMTWKRPDEVLVVATPADLATGNLIAPIDVAADGATYTSPDVWTGAVDPATPGDATCNDWSSASAVAKGHFGYPNQAVLPDWFNSGTTGCDYAGSKVICIEP